MKACPLPDLSPPLLVFDFFRLLLILLGRRLATMAPAHFFAQIGRLRIDRSQRIDGAERGREPE